ARQSVEVGMTNDGVHGPYALHEGAIDHLRAGSVFCLRCKDEARITPVLLVGDVVVVIDPGPKAGSEVVDETPRDLVEPLAAGASEGDVNHDDTPLQLRGFGQLAGSTESDI